MKNSSRKHWYPWLLLVLLVLTGCSVVPVKESAKYSEGEREEYYRLREWGLEGRVALTAASDSWTASVDWRRFGDEEKIRIAGPLGQGAVFIHVTEDYVDVDRGDGAVRHFDSSDDFVTEQLGFYVPLRSLRYWVMGLVDPALSSEEIINGFIQGGWRILYRQMQNTEQGVLPYRMDVSNKDVQLKLIIDQWNVHD